MDKIANPSMHVKGSNFVSVQMLNLKRALSEKMTPWELANMPPNVVETVKHGRTHKFIQKFRDRSPFFKGC